MSNICLKCNTENEKERYFCGVCGSFLQKDKFDNPKIYEKAEIKIVRILENLNHTPHSKILFDDMVDLYSAKVEKYKAMMNIPEMKEINTKELAEKMERFLKLCQEPDFQIAFVGTIKTGKSTLINSLLGSNYASMAVTPETAALTKFRSSPEDYVKVAFYNAKEWQVLWNSRTSGADAFIREYKELKAEDKKDKWVGHEVIFKKIDNKDIKEELYKWSSSKVPEHFFVKEIEVGISSLSKDFPKQVVFVDTPGLSDPVIYRSEITKEYIRRANAVFVCVDAQKVNKEEIETISSVFSFSAHNKNKVHIVATHWDKLNDPLKDWREQKNWLKQKVLVGKGFFDTEKMAESNITHSAAFLYNLCRDFEELSKNEKKPIVQFAVSMDMDLIEIKENIPKLMELTNIDYIRNMVVKRLTEKYKEIFRQDVEIQYDDIQSSLKRISNEQIKDTKEFIRLTYASMDEMQTKIEESKNNYEEIKKQKELLMKNLITVENATQKRLINVLNSLQEEKTTIEK